MIKIKGDARFGPMIYMESDYYIGRAIENYGENDYHAIDLLAKLIQEDDVIVDVGAHIGTFTIPLARLVPKGFVISFEVQPIIFNMLCGNVAINNLFNVTTSQRAVSDTDGQPFYIPARDYEKADNYAGVVLLEKDDGLNSTVVHSLKIDSMNLAKLKILKIDVEGMELKVLQGAVETIKRTQPIIYVEAMPDRRSEIESWMESIGYRFRFHEFPIFNKENYAKKTENILENPDQDSEHVVASPNLFCFPPDAEAAFQELFDDPFFEKEPAPPAINPFAKQNLSVETSPEITLELPKIFAKEE
jgi:FkbM family methyltransferase